MGHTLAYPQPQLYITWGILLLTPNHSYILHGAYLCLPPTTVIYYMEHTLAYPQPQLYITWGILLLTPNHSYILHGAYLCLPPTTVIYYMEHTLAYPQPQLYITWSIPLLTPNHSYILHGTYSCLPPNTVLTHVAASRLSHLPQFIRHVMQKLSREGRIATSFKTQMELLYYIMILTNTQIRLKPL